MAQARKNFTRWGPSHGDASVLLHPTTSYNRRWEPDAMNSRWFFHTVKHQPHIKMTRTAVIWHRTKSQQQNEKLGLILYHVSVYK